MEDRVRKAFEVAKELADEGPPDFWRDVFNAVYFSMLQNGENNSASQMTADSDTSA